MTVYQTVMVLLIAAIIVIGIIGFLTDKRR